MSVKNYFDQHAHNHQYHRVPHYYEPIINYLKKLEPTNRKKILDFGCGDGFFIKKMIEAGIKGEFFGTDLSSSMIKLAKEKIQDKDVCLFLADGYNLPLRTGVKFDIIHIDGVLHHIIGKTRKDSITKVEKIIINLGERLSENGILLIEEFDFISYIIPSITSFFLFYCLKLINLFNLDLSKISSEFQPGLEVNFFNDAQLKKILEKFGTVQQIRKKTHKSLSWKHLLLLKEQGTITYSVRIQPSLK